MPAEHWTFSTEEASISAGAICFRTDENGEILVLLITSRGTRRWVIPKGTLEPGEKPYKCAEREAGEEAGISGKADKRPIGYFTYIKELGTPPYIVGVFLLRVKSIAKRFPEEGQRRYVWVSPGEAAKMVQEPELQSIFRRFANQVNPTKT
ncbi:NUDIX hydrolase [Rhizobium sp. RCAM05350]|nr:NUDIX hydrolase [Rhizobium sp. RCAM05350]